MPKKTRSGEDISASETFSPSMASRWCRPPSLFYSLHISSFCFVGFLCVLCISWISLVIKGSDGICRRRLRALLILVLVGFPVSLMAPLVKNITGEISESVWKDMAVTHPESLVRSCHFQNVRSSIRISASATALMGKTSASSDESSVSVGVPVTEFQSAASPVVVQRVDVWTSHSISHDSKDCFCLISSGPERNFSSYSERTIIIAGNSYMVANAKIFIWRLEKFLSKLRLKRYARFSVSLSIRFDSHIKSTTPSLVAATIDLKVTTEMEYAKLGLDHQETAHIVAICLWSAIPTRDRHGSFGLIFAHCLTIKENHQLPMNVKCDLILKTISLLLTSLTVRFHRQRFVYVEGVVWNLSIPREECWRTSHYMVTINSLSALWRVVRTTSKHFSVCPFDFSLLLEKSNQTSSCRGQERSLFLFSSLDERPFPQNFLFSRGNLVPDPTPEMSIFLTVLHSSVKVYTGPVDAAILILVSFEVMDGYSKPHDMLANLKSFEEVEVSLIFFSSLELGLSGISSGANQTQLSL